jgi:hypothetical protein
VWEEREKRLNEVNSVVKGKCSNNKNGKEEEKRV